MFKLIISFIGGIFLVLFYIYIWSFLFKKKIELHKIKASILVLSITLLSMINNQYSNPFLKIVIATLLLIMFNQFLYRTTFKKSIIAVFISQIITMISEMIVVSAITFFTKTELEKISNLGTEQFLVTILIIVVAFLLCRMKIFGLMYSTLNKKTDAIKNKNLIVYFSLMIVSANVLTSISYSKFESSSIIITNTILTIIYIVIVLKLVAEKNNLEKISTKYNNSLSCLKEYEEIIERYKIFNHENKNQLLTISSMVVNKDKDIAKYISSIVKEKITSDEETLYQTSKIPEGGLRAIIYAKICTMDNLKINHKIHVSKEVRAVNLIELDDMLVLDICKTVGVFLDNAIDAVNDLSKKNVVIELFVLDKKLCISITNNFEGTIELEDINDSGYTTKGKGRGFGLHLVKELLKKNSKLSSETEINNDGFTQTLKIKM